MNKDFVIYVDCDGKMPILRRGILPHPERHYPFNSHKYWVEYRNDSPVKCHPYPGQTTVWDYKQCKYVPIESFQPSLV